MIRNSVSCYLFLIALLSVTNSSADALSKEALTTGSVVGRQIYGLAYDVNNDPLMLEDTPLIFKNSIFEAPLAFDDKKFLITGFGDTLGGLYLTQYDDDSKRYIDTRSFDLTGVEGLNYPRGGTVTRWGSVLLSESELINAADAQSFIDAFSPYYKGKEDNVRPYNYGWVAEAILLDDRGNAKIIKHYSVGRVFASHIFIMPDARSIYLFDSDNAGQLYLYVAKDVSSLSAGSLYGVRFVDGAAVYEYLGETSSLKMKLKLKKISFTDLFETAAVAADGCSTGFTRVITIYGDECLKIKKRNKKYAGLFEPIRMMALKNEGKVLQKLDKIRFAADNSSVELTGSSGQGMTYSLTPDEKIGSNYVVQELLR